MKRRFEYMAFVGIFIALGSPFLSFIDFNPVFINIFIISGIVIFTIGIMIFTKKLNAIEKKIGRLEEENKK